MVLKWGRAWKRWLPAPTKVDAYVSTSGHGRLGIPGPVKRAGLARKTMVRLS